MPNVRATTSVTSPRAPRALADRSRIGERVGVGLGGILVGSLMLVALAIRTWGLDRTSLWFDEVNSWEVTRLSWGAMLANLRGSPVGPLYFVLLKPWQLLFGDSEAALRAPSLISGI